VAQKKIAILQSNYIPWKGYFDLIGLVDEFIIYDEVQYTKNDWRNRNKIKTPSGVQWITIPVYQRTLKQKISETEISNYKWGNKNWNMLKSNYGKAPFFKQFSPAFEAFYNTTKLMQLSDVNLFLIKMICNIIGIKTSITSSTDYKSEGDATERLITLCKQAGGDCYLSGPAAKNYLREDLFQEEGLQVEWMDYSGYPEYSQMYPPFSHQVSIIDLIFNTGSDSIQYMKCGKI
jgi:hypothetical protein